MHRADNARRGTIGLQATVTSAAAQASAGTYNDVSQFSGKAVVSVDQLPIDNDAAADTGSQRNHDEVLHAACHPVGHLTQRGSIGIVRQDHRDTQTVLQQLCQGDNAFPRQVGRLLDLPGIVVSVGCSHAYALDGIDASGGINQHHQTFSQRIHVSMDIRIIFCLDTVV